MAGESLADDAGIAHLLDLLDLLAEGEALEHLVIELAREAGILQAEGVEVALHFGEALPENIAKQLGEPLAEQAVQAELQEDRQLEQEDAGDQQGLAAPRQVGGKRPAEAEVRVKDADESRSEEHTSELQY